MIQNLFKSSGFFPYLLFSYRYKELITLSCRIFIVLCCYEYHQSGALCEPDKDSRFYWYAGVALTLLAGAAVILYILYKPAGGGEAGELDLLPRRSDSDVESLTRRFQILTGEKELPVASPAPAPAAAPAPAPAPAAAPAPAPAPAAAPAPAPAPAAAPAPAPAPAAGELSYRVPTPIAVENPSLEDVQWGICDLETNIDLSRLLANRNILGIKFSLSALEQKFHSCAFLDESTEQNFLAIVELANKIISSGTGK